jgi:uncharacterized protein (TIGR00255 family)
MRSMTGFGRGIAEQGGVRATVDIRTVNHRFLDIKLRGMAPALEDAISTRLRGALERGAVSLSIHVDRPRELGARIDPEAAVAAHAALAALAARLGIAGPDLATVLAQPGVMTAQAVEPDPTVNDAAVLAALDAAVRQLEGMRRTEGAALVVELTARLAALTATRVAIAQLADAVPQQLQRRLQDRLHKLLDEAAPIDPQRLAQEVALLADRADVTEELVRLASHLGQAAALVAEPTAAVGRRLDFLVQEIGRELNTIGSKSTSAEITAAIVDAKASLEKLREQVQNVE